MQHLIKAGLINNHAIQYGIQRLQPGLSKNGLNQLIHDFIVKAGGRPAFLQYNGYPASICASVGSEIVHSIPNDYIFQNGDVVTVDVGTDYHGCYVDSATTIICGIRNNADHIYQIWFNRLCLKHIIRNIKPGITLLDIAKLGDNALKYYSPVGLNLQIIPHLGGHFCGTALHVDPFICHTTKGVPQTELDKMQQVALKVGDVLCIEPIITCGGVETETLPDGWTIVTKDGSIATHEEHTIIITEHGAEVIT